MCKHFVLSGMSYGFVIKQPFCLILMCEVKRDMFVHFSLWKILNFEGDMSLSSQIEKLLGTERLFHLSSSCVGL